jgi:hypothetical protein
MRHIPILPPAITAASGVSAAIVLAAGASAIDSAKRNGAASATPPAPRVAADGTSVITQLESYCRSRADHGLRCVALTPPPCLPGAPCGSPVLNVCQSRTINLDTRWRAKRVRGMLRSVADPSAEYTVHVVRSSKQSRRRWHFRMPSSVTVPVAATLRVIYIRRRGHSASVVGLEPRCSAGSNGAGGK